MQRKNRLAKLSLQDFANVSQIVSAILVIISLFFIWYQLREGVRFAKAENARSLVEHSSSFNSMLIQDSELATLWYSFGKNLNQKGLTDQARYREMLAQWLIFHENIYYQNRRHLLDEEVYNAWLSDLKFTVRNHNLNVISDDIEKIFPGDFGDHLKELQAEQSR